MDDTLKAILASIRENPDDLTNRLVAADRYEELGDADRAQYIRNLCNKVDQDIALKIYQDNIMKWRGITKERTPFRVKSEAINSPYVIQQSDICDNCNGYGAMLRAILKETPNIKSSETFEICTDCHGWGITNLWGIFALTRKGVSPPFNTPVEITPVFDLRWNNGFPFRLEIKTFAQFIKNGYWTPRELLKTELGQTITEIYIDDRIPDFIEPPTFVGGNSNRTCRWYRENDLENSNEWRDADGWSESELSSDLYDFMLIQIPMVGTYSECVNNLSKGAALFIRNMIGY